VTSRQLIDDALAAETELQREDLLTEAMNLRVDLLKAERTAEAAAAARDAARKAYEQACARLTPIRSELAQVAA
jgi:hypothetical protein